MAGEQLRLSAQDDVNRQLMDIPSALSNKDITRLIIDTWRLSDPIKDMKIANEYYLVRNIAINEKRRLYKDEFGKTFENETVSNVKIPSAFLRRGVNQKVNYAFGKPFQISVENPALTKKQQEKDTTGDIYLQEWQKFLDSDFRKMLKRVAKNGVNNGIGWAYVWIDDDEKLKIVDVASETIYPQWADRAHLNLEIIVRDFEIMEFNKDGTPQIVKKVEFWNDSIVERFIDRDGELEVDVEAEGIEELPFATAQMIQVYQDDAGNVTERVGMGWGKVPFISLKSNEDELPLLNIIKEFIDAYDLLNSKSVDSLVDDVDPVIIFRNLSSEVHGLINARKLLQSVRIAAVDEGGDAYYLQVKPDITAIQEKQEHLKKDIREFSDSVDTQDIRFGSNPSGVALKSMYQDLDTYVDGMEIEFEVFMENFKYFFDRWLQFRNIGTVEQWEQYKIIVTLDRDMMINDSALITDTVSLMNTGVSQETVDNYNPAVESFEIEEARRATQREKEQKEAEENLKNNPMFQFQQRVNQDQNPPNSGIDDTKDEAL
jgi:SPP1 family phage portal protein